MSRPYNAFDFILPVDYLTKKDLRKKLEIFSVKFFFRVEKTDSGRKQYTGTFFMCEKRETDHVREICEGYGLVNIQLKPLETNPVFHVDTPRRCSLGDVRDPHAEIPCDVIEVNQMYPWQRKIFESIDVFDQRMIDVVYDAKPCQGRTALGKMLYCRGYNAHHIPKPILFDESEYELTRWILLDESTYKCYIMEFDPRIEHRITEITCETLESLKDGFVRDPKGLIEEKTFRPPRVWIYVKTQPDKRIFRPDRYRLWTIDAEKNLVPYEIPE